MLFAELVTGLVKGDSNEAYFASGPEDEGEGEVTLLISSAVVVVRRR